MSPLHHLAPIPTPTNTHIVGPPPTCANTDQLDLQVSVSSNGGSTPGSYSPCSEAYLFPLFKIVNNGSVAVNANSLAIVGWFNANNAADTASVNFGGDNYRTWVFTAAGAVDFTAMNGMSGVSATAALASGTYGSSLQQVTFSFQTAGVTIPSGEYMLAGGGNPFSGTANGPFFQLAVPGSVFDPTCSDYSNLGGATVYTPPSSSTAAYNENSGWVLEENGEQVCEYSAAGTKDANTGVPAGGATCSCAGEVGGGGTATDTPGPGSTSTPTPTDTPTSGLPACSTEDQLDLQVSVSSNGGSTPASYSPCSEAYLFPLFKIVNNNPSAAVNASSLSIVGWFNADTAADTASVNFGGDNYRTWVFTALGAVDFTAMNGMSGVSATAALAIGTYGSSGMKQQVTFTFQTAGVTIPAGEYMLAGGGNPFSGTANGPFFQLAVPGSVFDPTCTDYSNLGGATVYTPPSSSTAAYNENSGWVLEENGTRVCEWTGSATKDANTGIPATGSTCSCGSEVVGGGPTATNTFVPPTNSPTYTNTPVPGASDTDTVTISPTYTVTPTATYTPTSGLPACSTEDQLDLQVSVSSNGGSTPASYSPCSEAYLFPLFKIVNNNPSAAVNASSLSIVGWFNANTAADTASVNFGGDNYRTWVFTAAGAVDFTAMNGMSGVSATAALASGTYGSSLQQVTFTFQTAGVTIPAGEYMLAGGGNPFSGTANGPFFQLAVPGAMFDPTCSDYSNLGGATVYTPPSSSTAAYNENSGWVLQENGIKVCEYSATGTHDPSTGIPATGAGCNCAAEGSGSPTNSPSPTDTPSPSPTFTPNSLPACGVEDHLDLQVSVSSNGGSTPASYSPCSEAYLFPLFKIVNNNASAAVNASSLSIVGWFNADTAADTASVNFGGDNYRTWVFTALGAVDFTAMNGMSGVSATAALASGTYGSSKQQVTFAFQTAGVTIPAGEYMLAGGGNPFSGTANGPFFQLAVPGADFDPTCTDYSNLGGATVYTPPSSSTAAYNQNAGWVLEENGNYVCEYSAPGTNDTSTGVPAAGATCSCP